MKEQIIQLPDNFEVKEIKDGKIILVEKEKLTYEDVAKKLFYNNINTYCISDIGSVLSYKCGSTYIYPNNCVSKKQAEKLLAINKLMNVAKYLNDGWQPNWINEEEGKYYIQIDNICNDLHIDCTGLFNDSIVYFKTEELAEQAIEILGEETIRLALSTDY